MNQIFDIYLSGVGGQGIGLLSEVILRAADHAGLPARGVDTHGLAQRGGTVESHVRLGPNTYSPLIRKNTAQLAISLELHEGLRAMNEYLKDGGTLVYYNTNWQPLPVRLRKAQSPSNGEIENEGNRRGIKVFSVFEDKIPDTRMQNIALLAQIAKEKLIPQIEKEHYLMAMKDLMPESMFNKNKELFEHLV